MRRVNLSVWRGEGKGVYWLEVTQLYEWRGWNGDGIGLMIVHWVICAQQTLDRQERTRLTLCMMSLSQSDIRDLLDPRSPRKKTIGVVMAFPRVDSTMLFCTRECGIRSRNHGMTLAEVRASLAPSTGRRPTWHPITLFWCSRFQVLFRIVVLPTHLTILQRLNWSGLGT